MLDEMLMYIKNLEDYNFDLYVTIVKENPEIENRIKEFKHDAKIIITENKGFDVYPFLSVLAQVNLQHYHYIIKLHTKQNMTKAVVLHGKYYISSGPYWRDILLCFLKSSERFRKALEMLRNDDIGMISHYKLIDDEIGECNELRALDLLKETGLHLLNKKFVMGTMFICKADLLKPLKKLNLQEFKESDNFTTLGSKRDGSLAHAYERLFGWIIYSQNKKIKPLYQPKNIDLIKNYIMIKFLKYKKIITRKH